MENAKNASDIKRGFGEVEQFERHRRRNGVWRYGALGMKDWQERKQEMMLELYEITFHCVSLNVAPHQDWNFQAYPTALTKQWATKTQSLNVPLTNNHRIG